MGPEHYAPDQEFLLSTQRWIQSVKNLRGSWSILLDETCLKEGIVWLTSHGEIPDNLRWQSHTEGHPLSALGEAKLAQIYTGNETPHHRLREDDWSLLPNQGQPWSRFIDEAVLAGYVTIITQPTAADTFPTLSNPNTELANEVDVQQWPIPHFPSPKVLGLQVSNETLVTQWHSVAREFSSGANGIVPNTDTVNMVDRIIRTVIDKTKGAEYSVDDDGALSFEAPLSNGLFIMCEVSLLGNINAGLYDGPDGDLDTFLARTTEVHLMNLF